MKRISIEETGPRLADALTRHDQHEPVVIVKDSEPIAMLLPKQLSPWRWWRLFCCTSWEEILASQQEQEPQTVFGSCHGMLTIVAQDEEHLKDFQEYMQ